MNSALPSSRSYDFLWLSLALFGLLLIGFIRSIKPHDYWFYVRLGKDIIEGGFIPTTDSYSYTYPGRPIFYQPWLSAVLLWLAHSGGGSTLTFVVRGICIALAYGWIWILMRASGTGPKLATLLTILVGLSSSMSWSVRPQMLAYPLFAFTLWALWRWQQGHPRSSWLLPLAMLAWANLHDSFVLSFFLMGTALLFGDGDKKQLTISLALSLLASFINPRHIFVWQSVSDMLTFPSSQMFAAEWRPPVNEGWQMNIFFAWLLLFIPLVSLSPRRLSLLEWIWFLGFGWLALSGVRYVIWFMFILGFLSGPLLTELVRPFTRETAVRSNPRLNGALGGLLLLLPLMLLPGIRESWWKESPPAYHEATTPVAAAEWLNGHRDLKGPFFAEHAFGSYLTFALPSRMLWIDNRFNAYPPEHWEKYQTISAAEPQWHEELEKDNVNLLMLSQASQPSLIQAVQESDEWCEQYRDPVAVIFSRCEPLP